MSLPHLPHSGRRLAAVCILALAIAGPLVAAPTIRSATLRFGGSPRLPVAEWAYLNYWLENPDDRAVTIRLSLRATEHGRSVFEKSVTLAARSQLRGRELVTADATSAYVLSLFAGSERLERTDVPVSSSDTPLSAALLFLNDHPDFAGASELAKPGRLREPVVLASVSARQAPDVWAAYGHTRVVVVVRPRYGDLSAAQFEALTQYVQHGGTVLFGDPEGTLEAAATPWSGLLPAVPLRVRQVEAVPELDAWGAAWAADVPAAASQERRALADRDGIALLESAEQGEGLTTLRWGSYPLIRWRRCGLGRVGILAVAPCDRRVTDSGALVPLWNHILSNALPVSSVGNLENSHILPTVLAHLTGFQIPSAGAIGRLLYGYVFFLAALLVCGLLSRRQAVSWTIAAVSGLVFTTGIFIWAFRQNATRPDAGAALLDVRTSTGEHTVGSAIVSLFSKRDVRPGIGTRDGAGRFRPLPSPARGKRREPLDAPLIVDREGDRSRLAGIVVQALKPREFGVQYALAPLPTTPATVALGPGPATLPDGRLPDPLATPQCRVFLLAPSGLLPVSRDGARLTGMAAGERLLETDPFLKDLQRYLIDGAFPRPAMVALMPIGTKAGDLPVALPEFTPGGYAVHLLPVTVEAAPGQLRLPPEFLRLESVGVGARSILINDPTQGSVLRMPAFILAYDVVLPAPCADLRADEVTVDLDVGNVGGNIVVEPRLACPPLQGAAGAPEGPGEPLLWQRAVAATAVSDGRHQFTGPRVGTLVQPIYGRCRLLLRIAQRNVLTDATEADRANRWRLNRLQVSISGTLPESAQTRRF